MSLLAIEGLSVDYGAVRAVDDLSLAIGPGEVLGLVGASGSGKSTVALAAIGLLPREARVRGRVVIDGEALAELPPRAQDRLRGGTVGMVFQEPMSALDPLMAIGAQVAETIRRHARVSGAEARARAAATLARVGLDPARVPPERFPHQLSGGQRQRVVIAIAIAARPRLLIADEPTAALDGTTRAHVMALLRRLAVEEEMGLLLVSHDLALVADAADRIVVMRHGRIVETGTARDIASAPRHAYARALVAAATHRPRAARPPGPPLLDVRAIEQRHRARDAATLSDVSLTVAAGESVGIVGESGAGKTTLLRVVLGLETPMRGEVRLAIGSSFATVDPHGGAMRMRAIRRRMQAVFQDPSGSFDPRHSIARIVAEPLHLLDVPPSPAERRADVEAALVAVGLAPVLADRRPHQLSGGERQRVALARALVVNPALLVLDEPVSALDPLIAAEIIELLDRLARERALALLVVGHDLNVMRATTDRLLVMEGGRIVEEGWTEALLLAPRHPFTKALVATMPRIAP